MIRAVGANNAKDKMSFVREDIDSLLVTNRTPPVTRSQLGPGPRAVLLLVYPEASNSTPFSINENGTA
jgi:hypothetical protein